MHRRDEPREVYYPVREVRSTSNSKTYFEPTDSDSADDQMEYNALTDFSSWLALLSDQQVWPASAPYVKGEPGRPASVRLPCRM